ncbi:MAG: acyl-CoA dehydrogenase family protein [Acidimicrobiia bacterium]|nr:acyl-CoA dehydrogenase family protein [Acidimicrobiia bacterium]
MSGDRFTEELREFLDAHPPPAARGFDAERRWQEVLHAEGWVAPHWPVEHGGRGASFREYAGYVLELARVRAPQPVNRVGINLAGPTLLAHGTSEQRDRYLAPILAATEIWCQLFSEPGAGSDLASLTTRARRAGSGEGWVIDGQKVWTSYASEARWGILLARTGPPGSGHRGLSYFVCDMKAPGIEVRPLRQMTGESEFSEVFLDGVELGADALVGAEGAGWAIAATTLAHERGTAFPLKEQVVQKVFLDDLLAWARERGGEITGMDRDRLARCVVDAEVFRFLNLAMLERLARGEEPGPESSLVKLHWSALSQRLHEAEITLWGAAGVAVAPGRDGTPPWREHLWSRAASIAGGTSEVQRNIVGERILGLPREPRP